MKALAFVLLSCVLFSARPADAFTIFNEGSHTVENIYQTAPSDTGWGSDRLDGYLDPSHSWTSPLSDFCVYDIKVVYYDGNVWTVHDLNTCTNDLYLRY